MRLDYPPPKWRSATCYLAGAVIGALVLDMHRPFRQKKLFYITLSVYLCAAGLTAFAWNFASYGVFHG